MTKAINKIYQIDGKLWVGSPNDKGVIECHPTRDISDLYYLPNSFVYEDDDSEWYDLDTVEKIMEATVIAIDYTCIQLSNGFSTTYLYVKADSILKFIEDKLNDCKTIEDYYKVIKKYNQLLLAIMKG